jgi:rhodanese-related sulfurtransferase
MGFFSMFQKKDQKNKIKEYLEKGAAVIDVRTKEEWDEGHIKGSKHIVLTVIPLRIDEIKAFEKPIITVCRSGARSGQAQRVLLKNGIDAINGGPWQNVNQIFDLL